MVNMQGAIKLSPNAACFLEFHSLLEQDAHVACFRWSWGSFHDERINAPWPSAGGTLCSRFHSFISGSCRVHLCVQRRGRVRTVPAQRDLRLTGWQRHSLQSTNWTKHYESSRERRQKKKKGLKLRGGRGEGGGSWSSRHSSDWCRLDVQVLFFFSRARCVLCVLCALVQNDLQYLFSSASTRLFFFFLFPVCSVYSCWCGVLHTQLLSRVFFSLFWLNIKLTLIFF